MKEKIINNPDQWIITRQGDFVRIKDSEISVDKKLEVIRQKLSSSGRFKGKTPEQVSKERYDKVLEEVDFDYDKLHEWFYKEENKDKVEIIKQKELKEEDFWEAVSTISNQVSYSIHHSGSIFDKAWNVKWRVRNSRGQKILVNEETGQVIYDGKGGHIIGSSLLTGKEKDDKYNIPWPDEIRPKENHTSTVIFLHGTYGSKGIFPDIEKNFPNTKFIYPHSPTLQYDMWHGSEVKPGGQCQGWINITGDIHKLMDIDVCPNNSPPKKNFEEADQIIHLDYPQLMRASNYVNEIIEGEIAAGIPPENIVIAGYSQGGLLTLATYLTSQHKLGGFISLCGLLPRWDKLLVKPSTKNKETPCLIINNSGDEWVPFWTGKKSYDLLKEGGYNVEFKTHPGLGHTWKNEEVAEFLRKNLRQKKENKVYPTYAYYIGKKILISLGIIGGVAVLLLIIIQLIKKRKSKI